MKKFLEALGIPTTLPTGHEIGCLCEECHAYRKAREEAIIERIQKGKPPETIMEIIFAARRKVSGANPRSGGGEVRGSGASGIKTPVKKEEQ